MDLTSIDTLPALFQARVAASPTREAYRAFDARSQRWRSFNWAQVKQAVDRIAGRLAQLDMPRGARVGLLLPSGILAVTLDLAVLSVGAVPVPIHALDNPESIGFVLGDCEVSLLFVEKVSQWLDIAKRAPDLPALKQVVVLADSEPLPAVGGPSVMHFDAWVALITGASRRAAREPSGEDLAAIVYTSGTTGRPKGVMLTHRNVVSNVKAIARHLPMRPDDLLLSMLPLSHTFERTTGYYTPMAFGASVAFCRSTQLLLQDLRAIRPTVMITVPRIHERLVAGFEAKMAQYGWLERLYRDARRAAASRMGLNGGAQATGAGAAGSWVRLAERVIGVRLRALFGGRLRVSVSGGAPLPVEVSTTLLAFGVPVVQGYGMTEASPVVAANTPDDNQPDTVGRPLPGVQLQLAETGELLVRGPSVMKGYWRREADTERALAGGWLHTGDLARTEDGRLRIVGRLKEIIVTSTGEKVSPADVEQAITADPDFAQAFAFGEQRPFIGAVVVPSAVAWEQLAARHGLDTADASLLDQEPLQRQLLERIRALTSGLPYYAQPRAVVVSLEPWTLENGLLTPTLKLKRRQLLERFAPRIDEVYARVRRSPAGHAKALHEEMSKG